MREIQAERITEVVKRLCISANNHLPEDVKRQLTDGTIEDWLEDSARRSIIIYEQMPAKPKNTPQEELSVLSPQKVNDFNDLANDQILRAGLRLGKLLNELFDK